MLKLVHNADVIRTPKGSSNLMTLKERINEATGIQPVEKQKSLMFSEEAEEVMIQAEKNSA